MDITIDTSALLAVCTNEPSKSRLIALTAGHRLIAPSSVHWEVGNALSAMLKRKRIQLDEAQACIEAYQEIPIRLINVDLSTSVAIASRFQMYAYDAYLIACALQTHSPLLTLDNALSHAAKQIGLISLEDTP
jgi:predicted nucleic acid-binding protein